VAELTLEDVELPEESLLGTEGAALTELLPLQLALERGLLIAPWVGIMRALTRRTVQQARERELFSRPLGRFQSIRMTLADMETRCELSTNLLYRTAWQLDHLAQPPRQDAAASRLFISRAAQAVARDAFQLHGLRGLEPDLHVERLYRDAMFLTLTGGGSEVLHSVIAGALLNLG
jgi:alkylation response protein AidB-like acyl-CoA dehydrogenase